MAQLVERPLGDRDCGPGHTVVPDFKNGTSSALSIKKAEPGISTGQHSVSIMSLSGISC